MVTTENKVGALEAIECTVWGGRKTILSHWYGQWQEHWIRQKSITY